AVLSIEQARAQYQIRRADLFPTLNVGANATRSPVATANGKLTTASSYNVGFLTNAWEIDFFGRIASLKEAALAQYLATEEGAKAAQISLIAGVANTWLALLADEELLEITKQTLDTRKESLRLAKLRFDNGASSELDFRQAESLTEAAMATLASLQRQRAIDENALAVLVGQPIDPRLGGMSVFGDRLSGAMALADVPAGLPSDLLVRRPDVLQAEQQLIAANANIGAARAAFFPRISLTAGFGTLSSELSGLFKGGSYLFTATPQALLPIFDAGRNEANLESAQVGRQIAVAQYEKAIQTAFREVADALAGRATLGEQLRAIQAQAKAEAVRFKLAEMRYKNGISSYLELLDAQRELFATRQAVVQIRLAQLQNRVLLYKALGGGWNNELLTADAASAPLTGSASAATPSSAARRALKKRR
ncbi:MAG: efflux transporter outer membrane subunit, partial [Burkholderiales bacterium]